MITLKIFTSSCLGNYPRDPIYWIDPWGLKGEYDVGRYGDDLDNKKGIKKTPELSCCLS